MYNFCPYVTKDGSVGLFSPLDDDIYHSVYGALTEAYEKFIFPSNVINLLQKKNEINILDICFGIGYNTKTFLNFFSKLNSKKFLEKLLFREKILSAYNDKIYTDNIYDKENLQSYIDKIDTNNILNNIDIENLLENINKKISSDSFRINIKAIDTNKTLSFLSPFISSNLIPDNKLPFKNEKIEKLYNKIPTKYLNNLQKFGMSELLDIDESVSLYILASIVYEYPEMLMDICINEIINDSKYAYYFSRQILEVYQGLKCDPLINKSLSDFYSFLHNIYYKYISNRNKSDLEALINQHINFNLKINDARNEIINDNNLYDLVFLDAFTPSKCPCLWSYDFFKALFNHLSQDGIILTYSTSAPVRNAMLSAGLFVGNIYNGCDIIPCGTIAAKNKSSIKFQLSEFDLGLLKTKSGIFYRDKNLNALNDEILRCRELEVKNSNLISCSQYKKRFKL